MPEPRSLKLPREYDVDRLLADLEAVRGIEHAPQPGPYHEGEWTGISLHAQGGRQSAMPPAAGLEPYAPTEALSRTPYLREVLEGLDCPLQVVRLLGLPPGGEIGEHFDYDTNFRYGLIRLHVPIVTHPDVEFVIDDERCDWKAGDLWWGDFSRPHHVRNGSDVTRVHLVADVEISETLLELFPPDFGQAQRDAGMTVAQPELDLEPADLKRYACEIEIPGDILPALTIGKSLSTLVKGAHATVRPSGNGLVVTLDGEPAFTLRSIAPDTFRIVGLPQGCRFRFDVTSGEVRAVNLRLLGVPEDLYAARLGDPSETGRTDVEAELSLA